MLAVCKLWIWMRVVCCCPLRNPLHCFFNWCAKHQCIFVQCKCLFSLKMSRITACWFSTWKVKSASVLISFCNREIVTSPVCWLWWSWEPFGRKYYMLDLDKDAKNWHEQGAWTIFWRFSTPGNKWSRLVMVTKYLSHSHFWHFFHSQWQNPSPSDLNPISPRQKQANPSSHFTPSGPSFNLSS